MSLPKTVDEISSESPASALTGVESFLISQSNLTKGATANQIKTFVLANNAVNVKDPPYRAKGDGVTDDTVAIQAAITSLSSGGSVFFPTGTYKITSILTVADNSNICLLGGGYGSVIKKGFNGDMISLGLKGEMSELRLDGNGANFTGRGVLIETGNGGDGWQNIHDCTILDTASFCIEYTASGAGWQSRIVSNRLDTFNRTTFAIKLPNADVNGPRTLANNVTLGPFADIAGSAGITVIGNDVGENAGQTIPSIQMNSSCSRPLIVGNDFECVTSITINGTEPVVVGNVMRGGYTVGSGTTFASIYGNNGAAGALLDIDNSGQISNDVFGVAHTYTPTWSSSGTQPVLNNGTITGRFQRFGRQVSIQIVLTMGSTTTFGTGTYSFSLPTTIPAPGSGNSILNVLCFESGVTFRVGVATVGANITAIADSGSGNIGQTVPFTWAVNDQLSIGGVYTL